MGKTCGLDLQIDIDWHSLKPFKAPDRLFASRADAVIRVAFPDAAAIWRARASSSLNWKDGVWDVASTLVEDRLGMLIDAIDGLRDSEGGFPGPIIYWNAILPWNSPSSPVALCVYTTGSPVPTSPGNTLMETTSMPSYIGFDNPSICKRNSFCSDCISG